MVEEGLGASDVTATATGLKDPALSRETAEILPNHRITGVAIFIKRSLSGNFMWHMSVMHHEAAPQKNESCNMLTA